jgi:hypothetical protein
LVAEVRYTRSQVEVARCLGMDVGKVRADVGRIGTVAQMAMQHILERNDVADELCRQVARWGVQSHSQQNWYAILGEEFGEVGKAICEYALAGRGERAGGAAAGACADGGGGAGDGREPGSGGLRWCVGDLDACRNVRVVCGARGDVPPANLGLLQRELSSRLEKGDDSTVGEREGVRLATEGVVINERRWATIPRSRAV